MATKRDLTPAEQAEIESAVASGETMTASGWFVDANTEDRYVAHESGFHAAAHGRPCSPPDPNGVGADEWIAGWREATLAGLPWSDALPAVALWLSEYPNGLRAVANWGTGNESGEAADYNAVSAFLALWGPKR